MRKAKQDNKPSLLIRLLNLALVMVVIFFLVAAGNLAQEIRRVSSRDYYGGLIYCLQDGEYGRMIRYYYDNHYDIDPFSSDEEEYYGIAEYADAAFQHHFYAAVGNENRAEYYQQRMNEAKQLSGELAVATEDIDRIFATLK